VDADVAQVLFVQGVRRIREPRETLPVQVHLMLIINYEKNKPV
jgi:hypothetical protein